MARRVRYWAIAALIRAAHRPFCSPAGALVPPFVKSTEACGTCRAAEVLRRGEE